MNVFLVLTSGYITLLTPFDIKGFVFPYLGIPVFLILFFGWKLYHSKLIRYELFTCKKTKLNWITEIQFAKPVEADLVTGRRDWMNAEAEKKGGGIWRRAREVVVG